MNVRTRRCPPAAAAVALFAACYTGFALARMLLALHPRLALAAEWSFMATPGFALLAHARFIRATARMPRPRERATLLWGSWLAVAAVALAGYAWLRWSMRGSGMQLPLPLLQFGVPLLLHWLLLWGAYARRCSDWLLERQRRGR
ncbi:MAG: hypothetical protein QM761_11650 [Pseudoxanthomonas sp.]